MNIKGEKHIIELKKKKLKEELEKEERNEYKIQRLKKSIERHKSIANSIKNKRQRSRRIHDGKKKTYRGRGNKRRTS